MRHPLRHEITHVFDYNVFRYKQNLAVIGSKNIAVRAFMVAASCGLHGAYDLFGANELFKLGLRILRETRNKPSVRDPEMVAAHERMKTGALPRHVGADHSDRAIHCAASTFLQAAQQVNKWHFPLANDGAVTMRASETRRINCGVLPKKNDLCCWIYDANFVCNLNAGGQRIEQRDRDSDHVCFRKTFTLKPVDIGVKKVDFEASSTERCSGRQRSHRLVATFKGGNNQCITHDWSPTQYCRRCYSHVATQETTR